MLYSKKTESQKNIRLPKQSALPSRQQVQKMLSEAQRNSGSLVELQFGDSPEVYSLVVSPDRASHNWLWMLYRGEGNASALEWSHITGDAEAIYNLIIAQFPGWGLKKTLATDLEDATTVTMPRPFAAPMSQPTNTSLMRSTLEGDLRNLPCPALLQSVMVGQMTGKLEILCPSDIAHVYVQDGNPIHCEIRGCEGEDALIELSGWEEGTFCFYPETISPNLKKSIKRRLEFLLMEGANMKDQLKALVQKGMTPDALIERMNITLTEKEFEEAIEKGTGYDITAQKKFYVMVDNQSSLLELLRARPLPKTVYIPILFNLVGCNLLKFVEPRARTDASNQFSTQGMKLDWSQLRAAQNALCRPDTNIFAYSTLLFFLRQEFNRYQRFGQPFSIMIVQMRLAPYGNQDPGAEESVPIHLIRKLVPTIERLKREVDMFGHYEVLDYAMILPNTSSGSARVFADRLVETIVAAIRNEDLGGNDFKIRLGCACIPDHTQDLEQLLLLAQPGKNWS